MPYRARHVANSLLERGFQEARQDMTPMKIQKLMFFLNGWHLATLGVPAIDISFEPWRYGPVVPIIYDDLKCYQAQSVRGYINEHDPATNTFKPFIVSHDCTDFYNVLDMTWEKYIGIDAIRLSAMTHEPGSPWAQALNAGMDEIPNNIIQEYFVRLAHP